jgi:hypothetical protein
MEGPQRADVLRALNRQSRDGSRDVAPVEDVRARDLVGSGRIRCPLCRWTPERRHRWQCRCGCVWNTFETRGRCPQCAFKWLQTQCLKCKQWSAHEDWYVKDEPGGKPA